MQLPIDPLKVIVHTAGNRKVVKISDNVHVKLSGLKL